MTSSFSVRRSTSELSGNAGDIDSIKMGTRHEADFHHPNKVHKLYRLTDSCTIFAVSTFSEVWLNRTTVCDFGDRRFTTKLSPLYVAESGIIWFMGPVRYRCATPHQAPEAGLEPTTRRLTAARSTIELFRIKQDIFMTESLASKPNYSCQIS